MENRMTHQDLQATIKTNVILAAGGEGPIAAEAIKKILDAALVYAREYQAPKGEPRLLVDWSDKGEFTRYPQPKTETLIEELRADLEPLVRRAP
jgi:hypothetical protein